VFRASLTPQQSRSKLYLRLRSAFLHIARRRRLAVIVTGCVALLSRALLIPILPEHHPAITDEFSYLLAADTFASGRLTNPPHPMWKHFESIHIMQQPTYASMYHMGQGMALAAGRLLTGSPWAGVLASVVIMCALLCWMLQGWLPPAWALLGGLLAVLRLGLFSYWINSYWGGAVTAIGGLLVLGALPRLRRQLTIHNTLLLTLGVVILANTRPYEGLLLAISSAAILVWWFATEKKRGLFPRFLLPGAVVICAGALLTCSYYKAVTGNPFRMPYQVARDQYASAQIFLWEKPHPAPVYRHAEMQRFYLGWELVNFNDAKTPAGFIHNAIGKAGAFWMFFLGPALTLPLIAGWRLFRDRRIRPIVCITAFSLAGLALNTWFYPHYAAPILGAIYVLVLQGLRHLRVARPRLARVIPMLCLAMVLLRIAAEPLEAVMPPDYPMTWYSTRAGNINRASVAAFLRKQPGPQLALVRYRPDHNPFEEWVYNDASIDSSQVVWAHDMGPTENAELLRYFNSRKVWLIDPDTTPPTITPY
jgi:hypothetical protein